MKEEFLNFLNALMEAAPDVAEKLMTNNIKSYIDMLSEADANKPILTDNGKLILKFMQENAGRTWKAKDIAEAIGVASRGVSGAFRKLVNDGFCDRMGKDPCIYCLTDKGINFNIEGDN